VAGLTYAQGISATIFKAVYNMNTESITDLSNYEMLDFISFAIQESMNGNHDELESAIWCVEMLREGTDQ
jgi:hypothetical protein